MIVFTHQTADLQRPAIKAAPIVGNGWATLECWGRDWPDELQAVLGLAELEDSV